MSPLFHRTESRHYHDASGDGWEFVCRRCGYRARYQLDKRKGEFTLNVTEEGDQQITHLNSNPPMRQLARPLQVLDQLAEGYEEEAPAPALLPYHVVLQVEAILRRMGFDGSPA